MKQWLSLFIARRFSKAKHRNKLVSFISVSSTIGISLGVMVVIIGLSAMNGFERELKNRVLAVIPHGQLVGINGYLDNSDNLRRLIEKHSAVQGSAPYVEFTALVEKGTELKAVQIRGVDPEAEMQVSDLYRYVPDGNWQQLQPQQNMILLGKGIADSLGVKVGDWLTALIPSSNPDLKLRAPKRVRLQVKGILSLGGQVDHGLAIIPLSDAQQYLDYENKVTGIAVRLADAFNARFIMREIGMLLDEYVYLHNWTQQYGYLYRDIQLIRSIMHVVMVLVIGVACFNIVSTLMMSVKDRASDIAVLRTMGAKDALIRNIFVWHGLLSGIMGSVFGSLFGILITLNLTHIVSNIESALGKKFLASDIYFVDFLPTELHWQDIALVSCTAILLSLIATLYPAKRACKLQPATVLSAK